MFRLSLRNCCTRRDRVSDRCIYRWAMEGNGFYLTTHSTHFIYGLYGVRHMIKDHSDSERGMGYSFRLAARVLLYAPSHRQDNTYHNLCYTSRGALACARNSSMDPLHEELIRRPIAPWANTLTTELHLAPLGYGCTLLNVVLPPHRSIYS